MGPYLPAVKSLFFFNLCVELNNFCSIQLGFYSFGTFWPYQVSDISEAQEKPWMGRAEVLPWIPRNSWDGQTQEHWDPLECALSITGPNFRTVTATGISPVPGTALRREDELQLKWNEMNSVKAEFQALDSASCVTLTPLPRLPELPLLLIIPAPFLRRWNMPAFSMDSIRALSLLSSFQQGFHSLDKTCLTPQSLPSCFAFKFIPDQGWTTVACFISNIPL